MKKRKIGIALGVAMLLCLATPAFGSLIVSSENPVINESVSDGDDLKAVTFKDVPGQGDVVDYFNVGYELSLKDAPLVRDSSGSVYTWASSAGLLNDHVVVTDDIIFQPQVASPQSLSGSYEESYTSGSSQEVNSGITSSGSGINLSTDGGLDNAVDVTSPYLNTNTTCYVVSDTGGSGTKLVNAFDNPDNYAYARRNNSSVPQGPYTNTKSTIGLETHASDYPYGTDMSSLDSYNKYYKPIALSGDVIEAKNQSEYCTTRITLQTDSVLVGNITLGAITGFARQDTTDSSFNLQWTQLNYQGFICGSYSELDLNGHDLIVESGSVLNAYGSITDSSAERTGRIILKSGATLYSSMVIEDAWRENSIPEIYAGGFDFMQMFRCPYLDCEIVFETGCRFYGYIFLSFGKSQGAYEVDIGIIGPQSENFIIGMSSGKIRRVCAYNLDLYEAAKSLTTMSGNADRTLADVSYQKIKYYFENATVDVKAFNIDVVLKIVVVIEYEYNVHLDSYKFQKWIPPYFNFYAYGSEITIHQEYMFMPGCYLFADSKTTLNFNYGETSNGIFVDGDIGSYMTYADNQKTDCSAGLVLCRSYYDLTVGNNNNLSKSIGFTASNRIGWYDTRKEKSSESKEGEGYMVWYRKVFWNYYGAIPARFDCQATLNFSSGNRHPYIFGGEINFKNNRLFLNSISGKSVQLWGSGAMSGPSTGAIGIGLSGLLHNINVSAFYNYPLISNGEVLTPLEGDGIYPAYSPSSSITSAYYDAFLGLVVARCNDNSTRRYAFLFDEPSAKTENAYYSYNGSSGGDKNSFSGSFRLLSSYSNNICTIDSSTYVFLRGALMPYRSSDSSVQIYKFGGFNTGIKYTKEWYQVNYHEDGCYMCRKVAWDSSTGWKITGQVNPW